MNKIAKNYLYNLLYQLVALIVPLITAPYLVRVIGAEGTGIYGYVNSVASLVTTMVLIGFFTYGNRQIAYVRDNPDAVNDTFWRLMTCRWIVGIFGTVVYVLVVLVSGRYYKYFALYYTYLLGYIVDCTWLFVGLEDMKWAVLKNMFLKLSAAILIFTLVKDSTDVDKYILIQGGSILLANLLAYTQLKRYVGKPKLIFNGIINDFKSAFMLFLPGVASTIYLQCDKIMIELLSNQTAQVSQYDYAEKIVTIPLSFITVISTVMMPRIANSFVKKESENIEELINKITQFSLWLACPLTVGIATISLKLIPWYLGQNFYQASWVIIIISPLVITNTLLGVSDGQYFTATNQIGVMLKSQITACIVNVIVNILLIPKYGMFGAAFASIISSLGCATMQYIHMCKQVKMSGLFLQGLKYFAFSVIMGTIILAATTKMDATPYTNLIQFIIGVTVYFGLCIIFKDKILNYIISIINKRAKEKLVLWKK